MSKRGYTTIWRSTISHSHLFNVASAVLMALGGALGPALIARNAAALCGTHT